MTDFITTLTLYLTAALSGFFLAHSIVLGAFFDHLIRSGNAAVIRSSYSPFRAGGQSVRVYFPMFFHPVCLEYPLVRPQPGSAWGGVDGAAFRPRFSFAWYSPQCDRL
jgi:hypothetical protein